MKDENICNLKVQETAYIFIMNQEESGTAVQKIAVWSYAFKSIFKCSWTYSQLIWIIDSIDFNTLHTNCVFCKSTS